MPRPPRIQFAGANYHIVTRGDAHAASYFMTSVTTNASPERLEDEVPRGGWIVLTLFAERSAAANRLSGERQCEKSKHHSA